MPVTEPHRASCTSEHGTPFAARACISAGRSSHRRYSSCPTWPSAGWTATSAGGRAKISQPLPASTDEKPRTSRRKARSALASSLETITWAPTIMRGLLSFPIVGVSNGRLRTVGRLAGIVSDVVAPEDLADAGVLEHGVDGLGDDRRDRQDREGVPAFLGGGRGRGRGHALPDRGVL